MKSDAILFALLLCACPIGDPFPDPPPEATTVGSSTDTNASTGADSETGAEEEASSTAGTDSRGEPGDAVGFLHVLDAQTQLVHAAAYNDDGMLAYVEATDSLGATALAGEPSERFVLAVGTSITSLAIDGTTGRLTPVSTVSPLPPALHGAVTPSRMLLVAEAIKESVPAIERLSIDDAGQLVSLGPTPLVVADPCIARAPVALQISPSGSYALMFVGTVDCSSPTEPCVGDTCTCGAGNAELWGLQLDPSTGEFLGSTVLWSLVGYSGLRPRMGWLSEDLVLTTATPSTANDLHVYRVQDLATSATLLASFGLGERVFGFVADPAGSAAWAMGCAGTLGAFAIDSSSGTGVSTGTEGSGVVSHTLVLDPSRRFVFDVSANTQDIGVWRIDEGTPTLLGRHPVEGLTAAAHDAVVSRAQ